MKKILFLSGLWLIFVIHLQAQKSFMSFGKISEQDLQMKSYPNDTMAAAVILGQFGTTRFEYNADEGFHMIFTKHIRIKILKRTALDYADFSIPLYLGKAGRDEEIYSIKENTVNLENGKPVTYKLDRNSIFYENTDKNHKVAKFTMPNAKEGSVIDVLYTTKSPFLFNLEPWYFQQRIPVKRSEYHVFVPEYFNYKNWTTGYIPISKASTSRKETFQYIKGAEITPLGRESGGSYGFEAEVYQWTYTADNVPAFIEEPYITTIYDYLGSVQFELISTKFPGKVMKSYTSNWETVNNELMDDYDFGKQLDNTGHLGLPLSTINSAGTDPMNKMVMAYEYIKNYMMWDKRYRMWPTENIRNAYTKKNGSSADINLNLIALLKALGLKADPVLVSTRSSGKIRPAQVILTQFNHVVACVTINNESYILDAVDHYCPASILPPNTLNEKGLLIAKSGHRWIDLYSKIPDKKTIIVQAEILNDFTIGGNYSMALENYTALNTRKTLVGYADINDFARKMEEENPGLEISEFNAENIDSIYKPLKISASFSFDDKVSEGGDLLYFMPVLFSKIDENPFKNDTRNYPVDFNYPTSYKYTSILTLPENYDAAEMPSALNIALPNSGGKFRFDCKITGGKLMTFYEFSINQTVFPSVNYDELKKFYEVIVSKMAEQVVLKKKEI